MYINLDKRVAIVNGGSKGIGKEIVRGLINSGSYVVACSRRESNLIKLKKEVFSKNLITIKADATLYSSVKKVIRFAITKFGKIDILVNNTGGTNSVGTFANLKINDWKKTFDTNVLSAIYFIKSAENELKKSKNARIINISSISGIEPGFYNPHYSLSKAAIINLTKYLANYYAKNKILVNVISAGPINSSTWDINIGKMIKNKKNFGYHFKNIQNKEKNKIPLNKIGQSKDIASMVVYLSSDFASWITGSSFNIHGGKQKSI